MWEGDKIFDRAKLIVDDRPEGIKTVSGGLPKIVYQASDSIKYSKDRKLVGLYGNVDLDLDSLKLRADRVIINNNTKKLTAYNARLTSMFKSVNVNVNGAVVHYDLNTKIYAVERPSNRN